MHVRRLQAPWFDDRFRVLNFTGFECALLSLTLAASPVKGSAVCQYQLV